MGEWPNWCLIGVYYTINKEVYARAKPSDTKGWSPTDSEWMVYLYDSLAFGWL